MSLKFQTFLVPGTITAINLNSFKQRTFNPRKKVLVKICSSPSCLLLIIYLLMVKEFYFNEKKTNIDVRMGGNLCRGNGKESGEWKEEQVTSIFRFCDEQMEKGHHFTQQPQTIPSASLVCRPICAQSFKKIYYYYYFIIIFFYFGWFLFILHFIYYPVSHSHRISNYNSHLEKFIIIILAVLGLRCCAQAFFRYSARGSHCCGFSCCGALALGHMSFSSCGLWAKLSHGTWNLPRPGIEPVSPALAGRFSTTEPPGSPVNSHLSL